MEGLLICDDSDEAALLSLVMQRAGLNPRLAARLDDALANWSARPAELLLVCIKRARASDLSLLVRRETEAPLVIVADSIPESEQVAALEAGLDWFVMRPYSARLLIAQIRTLMRRSRGSRLVPLPALSVGALTLNPEDRTASVRSGSAVRLTQLEFRLLYTLMIHRGQTMPVATLVERVWGYDGAGSADLVRGLISRLRAKLEDVPKDPEHILTVPGVGYRYPG